MSKHPWPTRYGAELNPVVVLVQGRLSTSVMRNRPVLRVVQVPLMHCIVLPISRAKSKLFCILGRLAAIYDSHAVMTDSCVGV
jgi:hypothetical protein